MTAKYRLGFDIGGTFTDFVLTDETSGEMILEKCLTTPDDPARGVNQGLSLLLQKSGLDGASVEVAIHATTLITNALIERRGLKTALVATQGFRDTLEMGSEVRYDLYDLFMIKPAPLIPRNLRFEIDERITSDGEILTPVDEAQVVALARRLADLDVRSVAIAFLHAYRNPCHERQVAALLARELPDITISTSSSVAPEIREYERTSTTAANAYAKPITARYLDLVSHTLADVGYRNKLYMMLSAGGVTGVDVAKEYPIRMLESGPAAGVLAAIFYARQLGIPSLVTFDMGGTTAKVGLVKDYEAAKSGTFEFGRVARFKKGSGLPVKMPIIELIEIGAGGGSIAAMDKMGLLKVGPRSASAQPGPACYGQGGRLPTVTDSNLVLGYLNPGYFLGGAMTLDEQAARTAIGENIADPLNISVEKAAGGIYEIVNQSMISAMKVHIAERGDDPRKFYLFAFGGAGPAHAYELARSAGMKGIIVPNGAGAASAMGLVTSGISFDYARSLVLEVNGQTWPQIAALFAEMVKEGAALLAGVKLSQGPEEVKIQYQLDLRHKGQGHEMTLDIPEELVKTGDYRGICELFYTTHRKKFGHEHRHLSVQLITCRATVSGHDPEIRLPKLQAPRNTQIQKGSRRVYFPELKDFIPTSIYDRYALGAGMAFDGPAIIEERECTIVVGPSGRVTVDEFGTIFIDIVSSKAYPGGKG